MSKNKKNKFKKNAKYCIFCGKNFINTDKKIAFRVDKNKGYLEHNIVIICEECHNIFLNKKLGISLINKDINIIILSKYFKIFGQKYMDMFLEKIYRLRHLT